MYQASRGYKRKLDSSLILAFFLVSFLTFLISFWVCCRFWLWFFWVLLLFFCSACVLYAIKGWSILYICSYKLFYDFGHHQANVCGFDSIVFFNVGVWLDCSLFWVACCCCYVSCCSTVNYLFVLLVVFCPSSLFHVIYLTICMFLVLVMRIIIFLFGITLLLWALDLTN